MVIHFPVHQANMILVVFVSRVGLRYKEKIINFSGKIVDPCLITVYTSNGGKVILHMLLIPNSTWFTKLDIGTVTMLSFTKLAIGTVTM